MLTQAQKQRYREQGYLVLENVFEQHAIAELRHAAGRIVDDFDIDTHRTVFSTGNSDAGRDRYFFESAQAIHCFLEEGALDGNGKLLRPARLAINKIVHALHDLDPVFRAFCQRSVFARLLAAIGQPKVNLWQTMYIFKQPGIGGEVRWHQDASYLIATPAAVTGIWIALEDAHRGNGCLWVQPGGHQSPLREIYEVEWNGQPSGQLSVLDTTPWPRIEEAVAVEVPAGSLVMFDGLLPHYSKTNRSAASRHAFTMHVTSATAQWSDKNWLQRDRLGAFSLSEA